MDSSLYLACNYKQIHGIASKMTRKKDFQKLPNASISRYIPCVLCEKSQPMREYSYLGTQCNSCEQCYVNGIVNNVGNQIEINGNLYALGYIYVESCWMRQSFRC